MIYLPGVSRADLRAVEDCPTELRPLVEQLLRGHHHDAALAPAQLLLDRGDGEPSLACPGKRLYRAPVATLSPPAQSFPLPGVKGELFRPASTTQLPVHGGLFGLIDRVLDVPQRPVLVCSIDPQTRVAVESGVELPLRQVEAPFLNEDVKEFSDGKARVACDQVVQCIG